MVTTVTMPVPLILVLPLLVLGALGGGDAAVVQAVVVAVDRRGHKRDREENTDHVPVTWRYIAYSGPKSRWRGICCPPPQVPRSRSVRRVLPENLPNEEQRHRLGGHWRPFMGEQPGKRLRIQIRFCRVYA